MPSKLPIPTSTTFFIATIAGLGLGAVLSLLFGRFTLPTKIPFEFTIGGLPTGVILADIILVAIIAAIVFLGYVSMIVRDTAFPSEHPWLFVLETFLVGILPASVLYFITGFRETGRINLHALNVEFLLLAAKFAAFHLLFQFSGLYTYMIDHHY
jgi:hypothetical protein